MTRSLAFSILALLVLTMPSRSVLADASADRSALAEALGRLSAHAEGLARNANGSEDRAVRKKIAPRASEIADDLSNLARRARKDASFESLARDTRALADDAATLVDLTDEAQDKVERKTLRAQASVLEQGLTLTRKAMELLAARKDDDRAAPERPAAMRPDPFARLVAAIRKESFDEEKVNVVRQAATANWFVAGQVGAVMDLLAFGDGKVDAAAAMWPHIVDPENSYAIFNKLAFDDDKDKLRKRVAR